MLIPTTVLTNTGGGAAAASYVQLQDQKATNTDGGTPTLNAWTTRVLNTEVSDSGNVCSLASNQFTLSAGTYDARATAPFYVTDRSRLRIFNTTDTAVVILSPQAYSGTAAGDTHEMIVVLLSGRFTITAGKALELQYYVKANGSGGTLGLGVPMNVGSEVEIYANLELWKVA